MVVTNRIKRRALVTLALLGVLSLPIVAYALGAFVVTRKLSAGASTEWWLVSQLVLGLAVVLLASAGGFAIWRNTVWLARAADGETLAPTPKPSTDLERQENPMRESVSRMLMTIERQAGEIHGLTQQLESVKQELESSKAVSSTDGEMGFWDRQFFAMRLEEEMARCHRFGHPLSLAIFGLDECLTCDGQLACSDAGADETLRHVAEILVKSSRTIDVICRYDEREFAVLLVETPLDGARAYAERVVDALSESSLSRGGHGTVSVGACSGPDAAISSSDLVRGAEEALHAARRAGQSRVAVSMGPGIGPQTDPQVVLT
ncbi:MAG TPA: diguanylate cyclase [Candidatus Methylomirabilis sp.]|nr:diguanylate cyclase [Candidatus Methylomirabilis sp.]